MLSPEINHSQELLTQALNEVMGLDKYATSTGNIIIGKLPIDPSWLQSVRNRVQMLGKAGVSWINKKPDIWSSILVQFPNYTTAFASVAEMQKKGQIKREQWISFLKDVLYTQLVKTVSIMGDVEHQIREEYVKFQDIQPLLKASILMKSKQCWI